MLFKAGARYNVGKIKLHNVANRGLSYFTVHRNYSGLYQKHIIKTKSPNCAYNSPKDGQFDPMLLPL